MKENLLKLLVLAIATFSFVGISNAACYYNPATFSTVCENLPATNTTNFSGAKYPELCSVLSRTLIQGNEGQDVRRLQVVLGQEGIAYIGSTGYFGPVTKNAVKTFQIRNAINPTGNVGPITLARIRQLWCAGSTNTNNNYYNTSNNGSLEVTIAPITSSGYSVTLGWNSKNANSCVINNETVQTNAQKVYSITSESNFTINCYGYNNARVSKTITVRPNQSVSNLPRVNLSINPSAVLINTYATLYWTSTNAYSCSLNGQNVQTSGSQQIFISNNQTSYQIICTGQNGQSVSSTVFSNGGTNSNTGNGSASITASTNNISSGQSVILNWTSTNTSSCTVSGGPTNFYGVTGSQNVYPTYTTTYYLSCTPNNYGSSVTSQVTVYVNGSGTNTGNVSANIYASPSTTSYSGQAVSLNWSSTNASYCNITGGSLNLTNQLTSGTYVVYPTISTSYQITCYNYSGQNGSNYAYVNSNWSSSNMTANLYASTQTINSGNSVTLSWTSTNANYCNLTANGNSYLTSQNVSGSALAYPTQSTNYQLTCYNGSGQSVSSNINVNINSSSSNASVTVTPTTSNISSGQSQALSFQVSNASYCTLNGGVYNNSYYSGNSLNSTINVSPTTNTTYTAVCYNSSGVGATANATVNVGTTGNTSSVTVNPTTVSINSGSNTVLTLTKTNINSCKVTGGIYNNQNVTGNTLTVTPTQNTTYTFSCVGSDGVTRTASAVVNIQTTTPQLTVDPTATTILYGENVTINLTKQNISSCTIKGGIYANATDIVINAIPVGPSMTTTYTFVCQGTNGGSVTKSSTITVNSTPSINVTASASTIVTGNSTTLTLSRQNTSSCTVSGGAYSSTPLSNSTTTLVVSPTANTTYTFNCTGVSSGTATKTISITVLGEPNITVTPYNPTVSSGALVIFTINKTNVTTCSVNGTEIGAQNPWPTVVTATKTFNFTCTNTTVNASVSTSTIVTVQ